MAAARIARAWQHGLLNTGKRVSMKKPVGLSDINKSGGSRRDAVAGDDQLVLVIGVNRGAGGIREKRVTRDTAIRSGTLGPGRGWFWRDCHGHRQLVVLHGYRRRDRGCRVRCSDCRWERYGAASGDRWTAAVVGRLVARSMIVLTKWSFRRIASVMRVVS